ncbi:MAG: MFS transporter [Acidobacteria bacterium]|nr:MFS transporter [Acidobacteriota bacterium]
MLTSVQVRIALLMTAFSVMSYLDRTALSIAAPTIIREFSLSETEMGAAFSAFQVSYTLLMIPGGRWADRFGPRTMLAVMGLGSGLVTALMALGARPGLGALLGVVPALAALRLAFGVFTAPLYPATGRMNANWIPLAARTRVQGIVNAGAGFGATITPVLFTWMIRVHGWRASFVLAGAVTMLLALVWLFTVKDHPPEARVETAAPSARIRWRPLLADRNLQLLTIGYFTIDYFEYIFFYWLYYYLSEVRQLGPEQSAIYTTMPFVAWSILMPLGGWLTDRMISVLGAKAGMRAVAVAGLALSAGCLFAGVRSTDVNWAVGLMSLALGLCAIADVVFWTAAIEIAGRHVGAACGIMNSGGNLGGFFAPLVTPMLARRFGWAAGLYVGGLMALIGLATWLRIDPERRIEHARQES